MTLPGTKFRKKLIEVALPLDAINTAAVREKSIRHGHPSALHLWWARRPLATARAVIFAQMVDDPAAVPERFPTEAEQRQERLRLFRLIEELVKWENTTNEEVLERARREIRESWRRTCADHAEHPRAAELFDPERLPAFHDPFAGGGALPLEAQRLGLAAYASDLNPVAVLLNKAMIELPPKFAGKPPVNPAAHADGLAAGTALLDPEWNGAQGLAEDIRYYGGWMRDEAKRRIGNLYPPVEITAKMVYERPDLKPYLGRKLTVIAWLWARTVRSPNPAFDDVQVPLVSNFMLSTRKGKEAYLQPVINGRQYRFTVKVGTPKNIYTLKLGTKLGGNGKSFLCLVSQTPMPFEYLRKEAKNGRMGTRLMAIVVQGDRERIYLTPTEVQEKIASNATPTDLPEAELPEQALGFRVQKYGMTKWPDLFTPRQLVALTTFSDLIDEAREQIKRDFLRAEEVRSCHEQPNQIKDMEARYETRHSLDDDELSLEDGGNGATAYAETVAVYLAFALSKQADLGNSLCRWEPDAQCPRMLFGRQAIPMLWDYAEANPLGARSGAWNVLIDIIVKAFSKTFDYVPVGASGDSLQANASVQEISIDKLVSTDPPYYDNIGYADLSDFFYVWLRRSLKTSFPGFFSTLAVPKTEELIATQYRHGSKAKAEKFFLDGMTQAMRRLAEQAHQGFPVTIYYAFKQSETKGDTGTASTGWETFLDAVITAGFTLTGTWPLRTENSTRMVAQDTNALATSIVLVCRQRPDGARVVTRREFVETLRNELPAALTQLQSGNIAPVDLAQAALGPGMAVYSRYSKVLDAQGKPVSVRAALILINETLDEALAEQEGDFDADSRWALAWFEQQGFNSGEYGIAETLSKAKNTSVDGLVAAGILASRSGKVRLLKPQELPADWDPASDDRLTVWEMVHHLVRVLETGGERASAELLARVGTEVEAARELCYRLYTLCERKQRAAEALWYNSLVQSWPEITRLARAVGPAGQSEMTFQANENV